MARDRASKSNQILSKDKIAEMFNNRCNAVKLYFSEKNPDYQFLFTGFTKPELSEELKEHLSELENDACLTLLASIEAAFRLDYAIRCEQKDKADISKRFRDRFAEYQYKIPLEDVIFEEWKKDSRIKQSSISFLKGAFKYRHWLAHGRYWVFKGGINKYDFFGLYTLAEEFEPLLKK